jgi:hypothetical protein
VESLNRDSRPDLFASKSTARSGGHYILANLEFGEAQDPQDQTPKTPTRRATAIVLGALVFACAATWLVLASQIQPGPPDPVFRQQPTAPPAAATQADMAQRAAAIVNEPLPSLAPRVPPTQVASTHGLSQPKSVPVAPLRLAKAPPRRAAEGASDSDVALLAALIAHAKSKENAAAATVRCDDQTGVDEGRCRSRGCATAQAECQQD